MSASTEASHEKAITCSLLITKRGDVEFEHLEENADDRDPYFQAFHCYRKLTNASMEGLHEFMSEEHFEQYNSLLFMTRLIVGDEDSIEDLKSESNSLGYLSILMAQTFQSSLAQYNNLLGMILTQSVIPHRPFKATKIQTVDRSKISPFRMEKVVAEVLGHTQNTNKSTLTQPFSAFVTSCFSTLKALDESNQKISIDSDYYLISDSTIDKFDKYINSLFSLLVTIISLKESLQIEIMLLQQMASSESGDADRIFCSLLGNGSKPHPHVEALAKLFTIHHDYQENTITRIKKIANDIDLSTFKQKNTFFSAIVEECLIFSENLMEAQSIFGTPGNLGKGLGKILSNEKLTKLGIAHCDKLHGIELALIEELDNIQLIPDRKEQSPEQRKQQIMRKKLQNDFSESNVSIADSSLPSINPLNVPKNPFANMSPFETKKMIENMSPDLMKSTLLSLFNVESELSRSTPASTMDGKNSDNDDEEDASLPLDLVPVVSEWIVDLDELKFKKKIGNGGAGTTYLSKWRREDVAVKVAAATGLGRMGWKKELRYLKNLHHPNVIRMLGCVYSEDPFAMSIILEFCDKGDLGSLLNKSTPKNFFYTASLGLANGLAYLHHKGIIHRDIKPDNILVHGNFETGDIVVKVIDFGLSVFFDVNKYSNLRRGSESSYSKFTEQTYDEDHTEEAGTYRWMAPEVFRHEPYNFKVDQYSFAIVLWQLLTREKPYVDKEQEDAARLAAYDFQRPPIPKGTPKDVLSLIDRCWSEDPEDRPMFHDICDMIEKWNNTLTKSEQSWLNQGNGHPIYSKMKLSRSESMEERPTRRNSLFEKPRRRASGLLRMSMSFGIDKKKLEVDEPLTSSGRARASRSRSTIY